MKVNIFFVLGFLCTGYQISLAMPSWVPVFMVLYVLSFGILFFLYLSKGEKLSTSFGKYRIPFFLYLALIFVSSFLGVIRGLCPPMKPIEGGVILAIALCHWLMLNNDNDTIIEDRLKHFIYGAFIGSLLVLISVLTFGNYVDFEGAGMRLLLGAISPSCVAFNSLVVMTYSIVFMSRKRFLVPIIGIPLSIIAVWSSISKAGMGMIACVLLICIFVKYNRLRIAYIFIVLPVLVFIIVYQFLNNKTLMDYLASSSAFTLTGRTSIWMVCNDLISQHPLFGYGYNSVSTVLGNAFTAIDVYQAHSTYYQTAIDLGIAGIFSVLLILLCFVILFIRNMNITAHSKNIFFLTLLVCGILLQSFTEATFAQPSSITTIIFFIIGILAVDRISTLFCNKNPLQSNNRNE